MVENLGDDGDERTSEMNQEPQRAMRDGVKGDQRDGLAAVAITLLTIVLVVVLLSNII